MSFIRTIRDNVGEIVAYTAVTTALVVSPFAADATMDASQKKVDACAEQLGDEASETLSVPEACRTFGQFKQTLKAVGGEVVRYTVLPSRSEFHSHEDPSAPWIYAFWIGGSLLTSLGIIVAKEY